MQARGVRDAMIRMANAILLLNYGRGRGLVRERDGGRPTLIVIPSQKRQQADMPKGKGLVTFWDICAKIFGLKISEFLEVTNLRRCPLKMNYGTF